MVRPALRSVDFHNTKGVSIELIDPRTLVPLDKEMIFKSVRKTGRLIIVDEARDTCSAASHIASLCAEECFSALKAPIKRVTVHDTAIPYSPPLEKNVLPNEERINNAVSEVLDFA